MCTSSVTAAATYVHFSVTVFHTYMYVHLSVISVLQHILYMMHLKCNCCSIDTHVHFSVTVFQHLYIHVCAPQCYNCAAGSHFAVCMHVHVYTSAYILVCVCVCVGHLRVTLFSGYKFQRILKIMDLAGITFSDFQVYTYIQKA